VSQRHNEDRRTPLQKFGQRLSPITTIAVILLLGALIVAALH
jgi:hypothetical protein